MFIHCIKQWFSVRGNFASSVDIWQRLKTFLLCIVGMGMPTASGEYRQECCQTLQYPGKPPATKHYSVQNAPGDVMENPSIQTVSPSREKDRHAHWPLLKHSGPLSSSFLSNNTPTVCRGPPAYAHGTRGQGGCPAMFNNLLCL